MTSIIELDLDGTLNAIKNNNFYDVSQFAHIRSMLFCNNDATITIKWSGDRGINTDYTDVISLSAGVSQVSNIGVRAKYVSVSYSSVSYPAVFRCFHLFHSAPQGLAILDNTGAGAEIYKPAVHKVRSIKSSDSSITVQELTNEIDLISSIKTVSAVNSDVQVTNVGNAYTIDIGSGATGSGVVKITNGTGDGANANYCIAIGEDAGKTTQQIGAVAIGYGAGITNQQNNAVAVGRGSGGATQGTGGVAVGYFAGRTQGNYSVAVGYQAGQTTQLNDAVAIGVNSGQTTQGVGAVAVGIDSGNTTQGNFSTAVGIGAGRITQGEFAVAVGSGAGELNQGHYSVAIGRLAGNNTQQTNSVAIGLSSGQLSQGQNAVAVGYTAGFTNQGLRSIAIGSGAASSGQNQYSVAIGNDCVGPLVDGRLAFGRNMEAVQTTATAGTRTLPANPAGFIRLEWNGTLYKIPVYND